MFEYIDEELSLKYKGQEYKFRAPSAFEQRTIQNKFAEMTNGEGDVLGTYIDFFVSLGLPQDVVEKISMKGLLGLFGYAVGAKKN